MKKTLLFLFILAATWACQDLNSLNPPAEFDLNGHFGTFIDTVFYPQKAEFDIDYRAATGNGKKLCVGNYQNFNTGFFVQFVSLPSDTMQVDSVFLELSSLSKFGTGTETLGLQVFRVDEEWSEHTINTLDEWHGYQPQDQIYQTELSADDTLTLKIPIDTALFNEWRYDTEKNNGLYFRVNASPPNYIREFESSESADPLFWPRLYYYSMEDTVFREDSLRLSFDATVFDYDSSQTNIFKPNPADKYLLLSSGIRGRIRVQFDALKTLPKNIVVQSANLQLDIDDTDILTGEEENSLDNNSQSDGFYVRSVTATDSGLIADSSFVTNLNFSYYMLRSDKTIEMADADERAKLGKNQIQNIINGNKETDWLQIQFAEESRTASVLQVFSIDNPQHPNPIRLQVRYFEVTNDGF